MEEFADMTVEQLEYVEKHRWPPFYFRIRMEKFEEIKTMNPKHYKNMRTDRRYRRILDRYYDV